MLKREFSLGGEVKRLEIVICVLDEFLLYKINVM